MTQGERIDELSKRLDAIALALEGVRTTVVIEIDHLEENLKRHQSELKDNQQLHLRTTERLAILEQRCVALEKGSDRTWQLAPMVISAVAVLISLLVAFLKK